MKKKKPKKQKSIWDSKDFKIFEGLDFEIRGKLGKKIYSVSKKGKPFTRKMPKKKYRPASRAQRDSRADFEWVSEQWRLLPMDKQEDWLKALPYRIRRSNPERRSRALIRIPSPIVSHVNFFSEVNLLGRSVGRTEVIASPPVDLIQRKAFPLPRAPRITDVKFDGKVLTVFWADAELMKPDDVVRVWMSAKGKKLYKQYVGKAPASAGQMEIKEVKKGRKGMLDIAKLAGTTVLIQIDVVNRAVGLASHCSLTKDFLLKIP